MARASTTTVGMSSAYGVNDRRRRGTARRAFIVVIWVLLSGLAGVVGRGARRPPRPTRR